MTSIMEQPAELFASLLMDNPAAIDFIEEFLNSAHELLEIAQTKDREAFSNVFESLAQFFRNHSWTERRKTLSVGENPTVGC